MGFLSQPLEGERVVPYAGERDWVTGMPFVDDPAELESWLAEPGRVWILADFRFDPDLGEPMRERIQALPLVHRSDPAKLEGLPRHPEWGGDRGEYRLWLKEASAARRPPVAFGAFSP